MVVAAASGVSNKWALPRLWERLRADGADVPALWAAIQRLVGLTLVAMQPTIAHSYSTTFAVNSRSFSAFFFSRFSFPASIPSFARGEVVGWRDGR